MGVMHVVNVENIHDAIMNDIYTEKELNRYNKNDVDILGDNLLRIAQMSRDHGEAIERFYGDDWTGLINYMMIEIENSHVAGYCTEELTFETTRDCFEAAFEI